MKLIILPVLLAVVMVMVCGGAVAVDEIPRATVIARAQSWVSRRVPYSQSRRLSTDGYRRDCSGYVSMAWKTPTNHSTVTLLGITNPIVKNALKADDILLKSGGHTVIFHEWATDNKSHYWGFHEPGPGKFAIRVKIPYPFWKVQGLEKMTPRRYKNIQD